MLKASQVSILGQDQYRFAHGKNPGGLGSWLFIGYASGEDDPTMFGPYVLEQYADACVKAKKEAARAGVESLRVLP